MRYFEAGPGALEEVARGRELRLQIIQMFLRVGYLLLLGVNLIFLVTQRRRACLVRRVVRLAVVTLLIEHVLALRNVEICFQACDFLLGRL